MTSSAFAGLSDADRYVVGRLAAGERVLAEELAQLPSEEIDQYIPGARSLTKTVNGSLLSCNSGRVPTARQRNIGPRPPRRGARRTASPGRHRRQLRRVVVGRAAGQAG